MIENTRSPGWRARWAAVGAAVAISLGAGTVVSVGAIVNSGERPVVVPITPCRLLDTRPTSNVGPRTSPLGPNETYTVDVRGSNGNCTIANDAVGVLANVTIISPTAQSFLTVYPADKPKPNASHLNWVAQQAPTPNQVTSDLGSSGEISIYNRNGSVHVIVDVVGYLVDHRHDDRYFTKNQTTNAIATSVGASAPEIVLTPGANLSIVDYVPDRVFFTENFVTTKAGYLEITKTFIGSVSCTSPRGYYLILDGQGLPQSLVYDSVQEIQRRSLFGLTAAVIPAGPHTIAIGGECTSGDSNGSNSSAVYATQIIVHPA